MLLNSLFPKSYREGKDDAYHYLRAALDIARCLDRNVAFYGKHRIKDDHAPLPIYENLNLVGYGRGSGFVGRGNWSLLEVPEEITGGVELHRFSLEGISLRLSNLIDASLSSLAISTDDCALDIGGVSHSYFGHLDIENAAIGIRLENDEAYGNPTGLTFENCGVFNSSRAAVKLDDAEDVHFSRLRANLCPIGFNVAPVEVASTINRVTINAASFNRVAKPWVDPNNRIRHIDRATTILRTEDNASDLDEWLASEDDCQKYVSDHAPQPQRAKPFVELGKDLGSIYRHAFNVLGINPESGLVREALKRHGFTPVSQALADVSEVAKTDKPCVCTAAWRVFEGFSCPVHGTMLVGQDKGSKKLVPPPSGSPSVP